MGFHVLAAIAYAVVSLFAVAFQLGLACGRPWGEYAMGGRYPGRWSPPLRFVALLQAAILFSLAVLVIEHARTVRLGDAVWIPVGVSALAFVLNTITPSQKERRLWQPMSFVMLVTSLLVASLA